VRERIWSFVLVSVVSLTIWLFAEAESLGSFSGSARVQFASPPNADRIVRPEGFGGSVEIEVRGPRGDISRARDVLGAGVRLTPDGAGIGAAEGKQTVNLFEALRRHKALTDTGVEIVSVRPDKVDVNVTVLETQALPIVAAIPAAVVEVLGTPRITPETAQIKVPRGVVPATGGDGYRVIARPTADQLRRLPPTGTAQIQNVPLELPEALVAVPDVQLLDRTATVELTIRNRNATQDVPLVPVQVVLPPIEVRRWVVRLNPEDEFTSVTLTGPADVLQAIVDGTDRAVAVLALSSDDLEKGITQKDINVFLIRAGVLTPLPNAVQAAPAKRTVRFEVTPAEVAPGP